MPLILIFLRWLVWLPHEDLKGQFPFFSESKTAVTLISAVNNLWIKSDQHFFYKKLLVLYVCVSANVLNVSVKKEF